MTAIAAAKPTGYFRLASAKHYLIVDGQRWFMPHDRRVGAEMALSIMTDGAPPLEPPGLSIKLSDIFA